MCGWIGTVDFPLSFPILLELNEGTRLPLRVLRALRRLRQSTFPELCGMAAGVERLVVRVAEATAGAANT